MAKNDNATAAAPATYTTIDGIKQTDVAPEVWAKLVEMRTKLDRQRQGGRAKTECPVTLAEFLGHAKGVLPHVKIGSTDFPVTAREFSSKSFGWNGNGKIQVQIPTDGGEPQTLTCQVSLNIVVANSKDADRK